MGENDWLQRLTGQNQIQKIMDLNQKTARFGLTLTQEDAKLLHAQRQESLREQQRVEFGDAILPKLIDVFCDSPYIYQDNYVDTMIRLQEIFYLYKNESLDELTDEELLDYMKEKFDGACEGSLDFLEDTVLEDFARNIRRHGYGFLGRIQEEEEKWDGGDRYE
jgi:hypothetical protein